MKKEKVTEEEAQKILSKKAQEKVEKCSKELEALLRKHDCSLSVGMLVTQQGNFPQVQIVPSKR